MGLRREGELLAVALQTGRHVVIEGPPGTGKSTLLRTVADEAGLGVHFVEGNAELTPARLVGYHDPALVLQGGYTDDAFVEGPLVLAMRSGSLLYLEELNRVPEETLNVLITALAEGEIHVPRVGRIRAAPRFRLIAAMNPYDAVGTARVSQSIYDRVCRIAVGYQDEEAERRIVEQVTGHHGPTIAVAVWLARATRDHRLVRTGSSVRGAIDMVHLAHGLSELRRTDTGERGVLTDSALAALSGRIRMDEGTDATPEEVILELLEPLLSEAEGEDNRGKALSPGPPPRGGGRGMILEGDDAEQAVKEAARRTLSRAELGSRHSDLDSVTPAIGQLDEAALKQLWEENADEALDLLVDLSNATDPELRRRARELTARIFVRMGRTGEMRARGVRRLVTEPGFDQGDLDLERTMERTGGGRPAGVDDLMVRRWRSPHRTVCLLLDRSGSMRGKAVAVASVAAASAVLAVGEKGSCSVVAFAGQAIVLQGRARARRVHELVDDMLSLRGHGLTDLGLALRTARRELTQAPTGERAVVLLSDCMATCGDDPLSALSGIERLHVLCTSPEPDSVTIGMALAERGGGRFQLVERPYQIPGAVTAVLT